MMARTDTHEMGVAAARPLPRPPGRLALSEARLVAQGHIRLVFEHDDFPGALIKVMRPERVDPQGDFIYLDRAPRRFKLRRRVGALSFAQREVGEFLAFSARHGHHAVERPFAAAWGLVETDRGLGQVVERLSAPDGSLAPTLARLIRENRLTDAHRDRLRRFFGDLARFQVCLHDMKVHNLVFAGSLDEGGRFVAVDGIGLRTVLPLEDWFPRLHARKVRRQAEAFQAHLARFEARAAARGSRRP